MRKFYKNKTTFIAMLLTFLFFSTAANASTPESLSAICAFLLRLRFWFRNIAFTLGAISFALMSFNASILGKFASSRLIAISVGLFVVGATNMIIGFVTNGAGSIHNCPTNEWVWI